MINKLIANIKKTGAPIVVGLDPMLNYIPKQIQENAYKEFGETLEGAAEAIWQFNKGIVDATYDLIPAVKPQNDTATNSDFRDLQLTSVPLTTARRRTWW